MRCVYCYNPDIVLGKGHMSIAKTLEFLRSRRGLLQGVVLSGGECTLHPTIFPLLEAVKGYGFKVKVDTNGSRPEVLRALIAHGLVDYIALDFKALGDRYQAITKSDLFPPFVESLALLNRSNVPFEVRTTVHSKLITPNDLLAMVGFLQHHAYKGTYYIQHYVNGVPVLGILGRSLRDKNLSVLSAGDIQVVERY